jgi:hypothetical protein
VSEDPASPRTLVDGYRPTLIPRPDATGKLRLAPHNLVSSWFWVDAETNRPVDRELLVRAFLVDGQLHPTVVTALDATGDGEISDTERGLFAPHQVEAIAARLREVGVADPRIRGSVQPFGVHHGVATGEWATRDCRSCHGRDSRVSEEFFLADFAPGGVIPEPVEDSGLVFAGEIGLTECGHVVYHPDTRQAGLYLFGTTATPWVNRMGLLTLVVVLAGVVLHGGLRLVLASARKRQEQRS